VLRRDSCSSNRIAFEASPLSFVNVASQVPPTSALSVGAVLQVELIVLLFLCDLEAERCVASRQAQHRPIHAELRCIDAMIAGSDSDSDRDQQQCESKTGPVHARLVVKSAQCRCSAIRCNSGIFQGL
jgi:hypothetical protein